MFYNIPNTYKHHFRPIQQRVVGGTGVNLGGNFFPLCSGLEQPGTGSFPGARGYRVPGRGRDPELLSLGSLRWF